MKRRHDTSCKRELAPQVELLQRFVFLERGQDVVGAFRGQAVFRQDESLQRAIGVLKDFGQGLGALHRKRIEAEVEIREPAQRLHAFLRAVEDARERQTVRAEAERLDGLVLGQRRFKRLLVVLVQSGAGEGKEGQSILLANELDNRSDGLCEGLMKEAR